MKIKDQNFLKKKNQSLVLDMILEQGPISRAEIAKQASMSPTSASRIVASLEKKNLIQEVGIQDTTIGRKATYFIPNKDSIISVGVQIDREQIRIGFMDFIGAFIALESYDYSALNPEEVVRFIGEKVEEIKKDKQIVSSKIVGICVGLPGLIENKIRVVKFSAQFNWSGVLLGQLLEEEIGIGVIIDNDLNLKAFGEYTLNPEIEDEDMTMIGFGSGVGSALISKGKIFRGQANFSGEIGHTVVDPFGLYCPCGNSGCIQTYIAEQFLLEEASKAKPINSIEELLDESKKGEKWAINIIDKAVTYAAITINNVICIYNPDIVVLTGSLIENHPEIKKRVLEKCKHQIWSPAMNTFTLQASKIGENGVVIGAALKVRRNFIENIPINKEV